PGLTCKTIRFPISTKLVEPDCGRAVSQGVFAALAARASDSLTWKLFSPGNRNRNTNSPSFSCAPRAVKDQQISANNGKKPQDEQRLMRRPYHTEERRFCKWL